MLSIVTVIRFQQPPLATTYDLGQFFSAPLNHFSYLCMIIVRIKINNGYKAHSRSSTNVNYLRAPISVKTVRRLPGTKLFGAIKEVFTLSLEYSLPFNFTGLSGASEHYSIS